MRISDWSSDVCSSDLQASAAAPETAQAFGRRGSRRGAGGGARAAPRSWARGGDARQCGAGDRHVACECAAPFRIGGRAAIGADGIDGARSDRKSVVSGKRVSGRVDRGGRRLLKKQKKHKKTSQQDT